MPSSSYQDKGLELALSSEALNHPEPPEWRAALFSLMLPLPDHALPSIESQKDHEIKEKTGLYDTEGFLRVPSSWTSGRFQGVRRIVLGPDNGRVAFYQEAANRFGDVLGESVGAEAIDVKGSDGGPTRCAHYDFRQRGTSEESAINVPPNLSNGHPGESVRLVSAELLQYGHLNPHDPQAEETYPLITRFIVLHLIAENCSSDMLDKLSQALHRPRNRLVPYDDTSMILHGIMARVRRAMSFPQRPLTFVMAPGGYLTRLNASESSKQQTTPQEREFHAELMRRQAYGRTRTKTPTALRAVCALPGSPRTPSVPEIWQGSTQDTDGAEPAWLKLWSWSLATGADQYWEGIPDYEEDFDSVDTFRRFRHWTLCTTESGIAHVRHPNSEYHDTKFWMLSMTRYVDLALLVQRCFIALSSMSSRLRDIHDDALQKIKGSPSGDPTDPFQILEQELELLGELQEDFVQFRDRLWFNVVPKHSSDTHILKSLRRASGVDDIYEDLVDEIAIRKEVYNTRATQHRMERERQELLDRQAEERRRREERDRDGANQREESRRAERSNRLLGIIAAALAVPGLMDITGIEHSWVLFGWTLALTVIVMALIWLLVRDRTGTQTPPQSSREEPHVR